MRIDGQDFRTIWPSADGDGVQVIDQTLLPHRFEVATLRTVEQAAAAISDMTVRGAPLIGVTAAFGVALAMGADASDGSLEHAGKLLTAARPTAVNLRWAVERMRARLAVLPSAERAAAAQAEALRVAD